MSDILSREQLVRDTFGQAATLQEQGENKIVDRTKHGRIVFIPMSPKGQLVAAESPPSTCDLKSSFEPRLLKDLDRHNLKPWRYTPESSFDRLLRNWNEDDVVERTEPTDPIWKCLDRPELVGGFRKEKVTILAGVIEAAPSDGPLPLLTGPPLVGKRTMAVAVAKHNRQTAVELCLAPILIERIFATGEEALLEIVNDSLSTLSQDALLVVSNVELLQNLPDTVSRYVLTELSRKSFVMLMSDQPIQRAETVALRAAGLDTRDEASELLASTEETRHVELAGSSLDMLVRASSFGEYRILPGRLKYLVRLSLGLLDKPSQAAKVRLCPDEVTVAIELAASAWTDET